MIIAAARGQCPLSANSGHWITSPVREWHLLLHREKKSDRSPQLPIRCAGRAYCVVVGGNRCVYRLIAHSEDAAEATADRHGPFLTSRCKPVHRDDRRRGQVPAVLHVVVDEWLGEAGIYRWPQRIAADRPLIVEQHAEHPMSRRRQEHGRRAEQDSARPENRIAGGRNGEDRANAPDQFARVRRRQEQRLGNIANTVGAAVFRRIRLADQRNDGARDDVPVFVQVHWNDRLDIEYFLRTVERPRIKIRVALEWQAHKIRDRVLRLLLQVFVFCRLHLDDRRAPAQPQR